MTDVEPFGKAEQSEVVSAPVLEVMERATIDIQIATAKRFPRDQRKAAKMIQELALSDPQTAEEMYYCLERKKKDGTKEEIVGPSVRLAEIAQMCWGNLRSAAQIVSNDGSFVRARGLCWDLESNNAVSMDSEKSIRTSGGSRYSNEMQAVVSAATAAIAWRNAIIKVIGRVYFDRIVEAARQKVAEAAKADPSIRTKAFASLGKVGVTEGQILAYLDRATAEQITGEDISRLAGIANAIRNKETTVAEVFGGEKETPRPLFKSPQKADGTLAVQRD